ncbi:MAG: N-acetylglucosamine kinase [Chitinophagales bacterium]|nr:N-acetylglucosamine kinase [Chitinophagales bacterium]
MYLIADSGSTKTDWVVLDAQGEVPETFFTKGFNPTIVSTLFIIDALKQSAQFLKAIPATKKIFFYGSGCSTPELNNVIIEAFRLFSPAVEIEIKNDLYASVHATTGNDPAIVCIIGTGSNACSFDGNQVTDDDFSLGYILGDEGSGSYLGKQLLKDFFYDTMPAAVSKAFNDRYHLKRNEVIERIYRRERPNEFLASFVPFIRDHIQNEYCRQMVEDSFDSFIQYFILRFAHAGDVSIHCTGSVGYYFKDIFEICLHKHTLKPGKILVSPMDGLVRYVKKYLIS